MAGLKLRSGPSGSVKVTFAKKTTTRGIKAVVLRTNRHSLPSTPVRERSRSNTVTPRSIFARVAGADENPLPPPVFTSSRVGVVLWTVRASADRGDWPC